MTKKLQTKKSGFTLVELIVVIAILGILAAITIPRFSQYTQNAKDTALDSNAKTVYNACAAAETKLIAEGTATPTSTTIARRASESLSGVTLAAGTDSDGKDDTFTISAYTPPTADAPSSFTIQNSSTDGKYEWVNGGVRVKK